MGLSLIAAAPDMDQQLKFMNSMGAFASITPGQWVGEQGLGSLGLAEDPSQGFQQFQQVTNTLADTAIRLKEAGVFGGNKNKNKGRQQGGSNPLQHGGPSPMSMAAGGSGGGIPSWLLWGGGILVAGLLLYVLMKKKKNRDKDPEPLTSTEVRP